MHVEIATGITSIAPDGVRYRGYPSAQLARSATFEQVAALLWTGELPAEHHGWTSSSANAIDGARLTAGDARLTSSDVVRLVAADFAARCRTGTAQFDITTIGRGLIASMVDSLPVAGDGRSPRLMLAERSLRGTIAGRLWAALAPRRASSELVAVLNGLLVLMADHELAASTVAARVAASVRADPASCVVAGLAALGGPLHGAASRHACLLVDRACAVGPSLALAESSRPTPGFGHSLYTATDPRATVVFEWLRCIDSATRTIRICDELTSLVAERSGRYPNVDLALAAFTTIAGMSPDAGETIVAVARTAGWLAHVAEEYEATPLRYRARAVYQPTVAPVAGAG
jgi:citrate synthase